MVRAMAGPWLLGATLLLSLLTATQVAADTTLVVLLPPSEGEEGAEAGSFPLTQALESVIRLGVERVNGDGVLLDDKEVTLFTHTSTGVPAAAALCESIESNDTVVAVVSALDTYSTALMGSISNEYLDLPLMSVAGTAARAESRNETEGGYLLHTQPGVVPQMQALVRLILDMKLARDAVDGRSEATERVWLVHTSDTFGTIATAAFNNAATTISVALPDTSDDEDDDDGSGEEERATVEVAGTVVIAASSEAMFDSELATLVDNEASIIVLLAEGFDGAIVRTVLSQANEAGLTEGVQWYLPNVAAFDHVFDRNSTYRDASLAFDMRGALGVRACTPRTGDGATMAEELSQEWVRLDADEYPGAGPDGVTADGQIDPVLAFAYDSIFLAAAAAQMAQDTLTLANVNDSGLQGIVLDSCPFPRNGSWADGALMRDSLLSASGTLVGATGPLGMSVGEDDDGRDADTVTFCAVNLKPDATHGARFEVISTLDGATLESEDGEGFQAISPFQEAQTFPAGALTYPPDRPILQGRHMDVVMRRDAPPFVFVDGDGSSIDDFTGITPEFLKQLADVVGFTYSLRAPPEGTATPETIEMVRNGSADMTGSWITITSERAEYVSFTYPYFDLGIAFVYLPTIDEGVNFWKAFAPFEASLWLMLLVSLVVTVFLLWLFEGAKNAQFSRGGWGRRHRTVTRGISRSVYVTSSLMMSQLTHKPETLEGYLLTLGWLFTSFVLAASYTAELASFLTASKLETTSLTIDALKTGEIPHSQVALLQGGNTQVLYERDFKGCSGLEECSLGIQPQPCYSTVECFTMVLNGSALTTLADSATADYELQNDFCGLTTLAEVLYPQHYGLVLPYGSGLTEELQAATLQLREDGTLSDIEEAYLDPSAVCVPVTTSEEESSNMTVSDVSGVFFVLGLFVVAATVSWCFRRSPWAKRAKERRRLEKGGAAERSVMDSYAKMSRGQQKAFAMQATVNLLQHSRELSASSKTLMEGINEVAKKAPDATGAAAAAAAAAPPNPATGDAGGGGEGGGRRAAPTEADFRREMAEGRPVVGIGGGMGDSGRGFTRRAPSLSGLLSRLPGRRGGGDGGAGGGGGNPTREQHQRRRRRDSGGGGGGGLNLNPDPMMYLVGGDRESESWSSTGSPVPVPPPRSPRQGRRSLVVGASSSNRPVKRGQGVGGTAAPPAAAASAGAAAKRVSTVPDGEDAGGMERGSNAPRGLVHPVAGSGAAGAGTAATPPAPAPAAAAAAAAAAGVAVPTLDGVPGTQASAVAPESLDGSAKAE